MGRRHRSRVLDTRRAWFRKRRERRWPLAAVLLGLTAFGVGLWQRQQGWQLGEFALVPAEFARGMSLGGGVSSLWQPPLITPLSTLFLHAGWAHLIGNLIYWALFAPGVEKRLGAPLLAILLLACGVLANLSSVWLDPTDSAPLVGMSGMVSASMGAYLGLFPRSKIGVVLPLGLYFQYLKIPALGLIGSWCAFQVLYTFFGDALGTVAWWTHIAGFLAGLVLALPIHLLTDSRLRSAP